MMSVDRVKRHAWFVLIALVATGLLTARDSAAAADISTRERIVRLRGRRYRYQEIAPAEVLRLLEKPEGTIPIHRLQPIPDKKSLEDLIAAFQGRR